MTISEIAKLAGVSTATVSRYFNQGYVSEEKKQIIRRIVEETGFSPSPHAQMLRTKQTRTIGVIIPKINSETVSRMVAGINRVLTQEKYLLVLGDTENDEREELKFLDLFRNKQVDGVILIGTVLSAKHKQRIKNLDVPFVLLGQRMLGVNSVYHDNYEAVYALASKLAQNGKVFAMIAATEADQAAGSDRRRAYWDALRELGKSEKVFFEEARFDLHAAREACSRLFEAHPDIDTLFCATDNMAVGALQHLHSIGKTIPHDIQLAGVGDTLISDVANPTITSIAFPYEESGQVAAELLLQSIVDENASKKEIKIAYKISYKGSTR